jgi:hypothetical protein
MIRLEWGLAIAAKVTVEKSGLAGSYSVQRS